MTKKVYESENVQDTKNNKNQSHNPRPYEQNNKAQNINMFLMVGLLIIGLIGAAIWFLSKNKKVEDNYNSTGIVQANDPIYGKKDSKLEMIIIEDFFCGHCRDENPVFDALIQKYKDEVKFVYKPIEVITGSKDIIPYAMAANEQGKYKEFSTQAFEKSSQLYNSRKETMKEIAKSIPGLDYDKWYDEGTNNLELRKKGEQNKADLKMMELQAIGIQEAKPKGRDFPGTPGVILMKDGKVKDWWSGSIGGNQDLNEKVKILEEKMKNAYGAEFTVK